MARVEYKYPTERDDIFLIMNYINSCNIDEPPTQDSIVLYTIHKIIPDLKKGSLIYAYSPKNDEVLGYCRTSATFDPETEYVHELHSVNDNISNGLFRSITDELVQSGIKRLVWYPHTKWNEYLNRRFGIEGKGDALEFAVLHIDEEKVEVKSVKKVEPQVYSEKPLITDIVSMADLEMCYEVQKATNWGEFATPPRILLPAAFLHRIGYRSGYMIAVRDKNNRIIGFVRISATRTPGCVYGHEQVILPEYVGRGLGTALDTILAVVAIESGVRRAYGTIDPTNIRSLALSLREVGMRGVAVEENLFGHWATTEALGGITHRIIVVFDDTECHADRDEAVEIDVEHILELAEGGKAVDLGRSVFVSMGMDLETFMKEGHMAKEVAKEGLKYLLNVCRYSLTDVLYEGSDIKYLVTRCDGNA